jgi:hypothetical protein
MSNKLKITTNNFLKQSTIDELMNASWRKTTLVTSGAYMYCTMGTHEDVLNKPIKNGMYINKNPILTVQDCEVSEADYEYLAGVEYKEPKPEVTGNLHSFGYCRSKLHPLKQNNIGVPYEPEMQDYLPDTGVELSGDENRLYPCVPSIAPQVSFSAPTNSTLPFGVSNLLGLSISKGEWQDGHEKLKIDGVPALTSKSCLNCIYGGKIQLLSNGMEPVPSELLDQKG